LATAFGYPVGFSDHTKGLESALGAVALGACWIEKHFTLDRGLSGPDHSFSADPVEFKELVRAIRHIESNLGSSFFEPTVAEGVGRTDFRLSCVAAYDFSAGHVLASGDVVFRRPGTGLPPKSVSWLTGQRLQHSVRKGEVFSPAHFA
jgi:N-acetylneuraminate synthase/N,N'-diacetyllegionaminate synthase